VTVNADKTALAMTNTCYQRAQRYCQNSEKVVSVAVAENNTSPTPPQLVATLEEEEPLLRSPFDSWYSTPEPRSPDSEEAPCSASVRRRLAAYSASRVGQNARTVPGCLVQIARASCCQNRSVTSAEIETWAPDELLRLVVVVGVEEEVEEVRQVGLTRCIGRTAAAAAKNVIHHALGQGYMHGSACSGTYLSHRIIGSQGTRVR
jgi:hypothetical protein